VGIKEVYKRTGVRKPANPRKGLSIYDLKKPPNVTEARWNKITCLSYKQNYVKAYMVNETDDGRPARQKCRRCRERGVSNCSFWAVHSDGPRWENCILKGKPCDEGVREEDEGSQDAMGRRTRKAMYPIPGSQYDVDPISSSVISTVQSHVGTAYADNNHEVTTPLTSVSPRAPTVKQEPTTESGDQVPRLLIDPLLTSNGEDRAERGTGKDANERARRRTTPPRRLRRYTVHGMAAPPESDERPPPVTIRRATPQDVPAINLIHKHYVENTVLTFATVANSYDEALVNFHTVQGLGSPYLVAADHTGTILGYCYVSPFRGDKPRYQRTLELSLFCHPDHVRRGAGKQLLSRMIEILSQPDTWQDWYDGSKLLWTPPEQLIAVMAVDTNGPGSGLKLRNWYVMMGFEEKGRLSEVGWKMGRWIDTIYLQRRVGP